MYFTFVHLHLHTYMKVCVHLGTSTFEGAFIDLQTRVLPPEWFHFIGSFYIYR